MSTAPAPDPTDLDALMPPPAVQLRPLPPSVAAPTRLLFGTLSKLRGRRAMHPVGLVASARLKVPADPRLPEAWRALDGSVGVVRFSKGVGLPPRVPDVLGVALRFGTQDLLLASAAAGVPALQHLLVPARRFDGTVFSSLLAHRLGGRLAVLQAQMPGKLPPSSSALEAVREAASPQLRLSAAGLLGGRIPLGVVTVGAAIEGEPAAQLRFDPWRTGAGIEPVGPVQRLRAAAYAGSRRATRH